MVSKQTPRLVIVVVLVLAITVLVGGCGDGNKGTSQTRTRIGTAKGSVTLPEVVKPGSGGDTKGGQSDPKDGRR